MGGGGGEVVAGNVLRPTTNERVGPLWRVVGRPQISFAEILERGEGYNENFSINSSNIVPIITHLQKF